MLQTGSAWGMGCMALPKGAKRSVGTTDHNARATESAARVIAPAADDITGSRICGACSKFLTSVGGCILTFVGPLLPEDLPWLQEMLTQAHLLKMGQESRKIGTWFVPVA